MGVIAPIIKRNKELRQCCQKSNEQILIFSLTEKIGTPVISVSSENNGNRLFSDEEHPPAGGGVFLVPDRYALDVLLRIEHKF